ncbi:MAG: universal stress protein [Halioglobus sp.]
MSYRNIVVAVDTSDESEHILKAAKELMAEEGASIAVVTIIQPLAGFYVDMYSMLGDPKRIESQAVEQARASLSELLSRHGIPPESAEVIMGAPAVEIRELAKSKGSDVIVLGTHGQHGLGLMLGSTANAVLHGATCDVLAVRVGKKA